MDKRVKAEIIDFYVKAQTNINSQDILGDTALMLASRNGHKVIVELLLKYMADVNLKNHVGNRALILAAEAGYKEILDILIKNKADVNLQNRFGNTALMLAAKNGYIDVVKILIKNNANVNLRNNEGNTALRCVSVGSFDSSYFVNDLIKYKSDLTKENELNLKILRSYFYNYEVAELLVDAGATL